LARKPNEWYKNLTMVESYGNFKQPYSASRYDYWHEELKSKKK
jgi:hypothetical protein